MLRMLDPVAIVEQRREYKLAARQIKAEESLCYPEFSTAWIYSHWYNNVKHPDGRINFGTDKNGKLVAITVSPYSDTFWDNIEPRVGLIIKKLLKLGYMTFSSCDGHGEYSARFVWLAFDNRLKRDEAYKYFRKITWFIPGVSIEKTSNPSNLRSVDNYIENVGAENIDIKSSIKYFNTVFHKLSTEWYFLKVVIFRDNKDRLKRRFLKEPVTDYLIHKLDKFPRYRDL